MGKFAPRPDRPRARPARHDRGVDPAQLTARTLEGPPASKDAGGPSCPGARDGVKAGLRLPVLERQAVGSHALSRRELVHAGVVGVVHEVRRSGRARAPCRCRGRAGSRRRRLARPACRRPGRRLPSSRPGTCGRGRASGRPRGSPVSPSLYGVALPPGSDALRITTPSSRGLLAVARRGTSPSRAARRRGSRCRC